MGKMKKCKKWREEKLPEGFYANKQKVDGCFNICKECYLKHCAIYRDQNRKKYRKKSHLENMNEEQKAKRTEYSKEWIAKNREKWNAYFHYHDGGKKNKAKHAVVKIRKKKQPEKCSICNIKIEPSKIHGHHPNYDKPFDIVWCCSRCHGRIHRIDTKQIVPSNVAL